MVYLGLCLDVMGHELCLYVFGFLTSYATLGVSSYVRLNVWPPIVPGD